MRNTESESQIPSSYTTWCHAEDISKYSEKAGWLSFRRVAAAKSIIETNIGFINGSMNGGFSYAK